MNLIYLLSSTEGIFCVKDFTRKTLVLQATFPTYYLSRTHIHIILETLGTLHFLRHVQVVFIIVSFPRVCENGTCLDS